MEPPVPPTTIDPDEEVPIQKMPVEILEMTLDLLPFPDLFACLKVCRQFRDAIAASKLLRKTMACGMIITQEREGCGKATTSHEPCSCGSCASVRQGLPEIRPFTHPDPIARRLCPLLFNADLEGKQLETNYEQCLVGGYPISNALKFSAYEYFRDVATWAPVYLTSPHVRAARLRLKFKLVCCDKHQGFEMQNILPTSTVGEKESGLTLGHLVRSTMDDMGLCPDIEVGASRSPETPPRKGFLIYPPEWIKGWAPELFARLGPLRVELSEKCWVQLMTPCEDLRAERISQELKSRNAQLATLFWYGMACVHMATDVPQGHSTSRV